LTSGHFSSISLKEIEIDRKHDGQPFLNYQQNKIEYCKISISHTSNYATAFALYFSK
jgi:phosphopantetheinyl transferase (holo-ACP synthase)